MKKKLLVICIIVVIAALLTVVAVNYFSVDRSAQRIGEDGFVIQGETYRSTSVGYSGEGKVIAKADGYDIMVLPEDPARNFLAVRSFTDNWIIVKESYEIPTEGKLNVAYLDYERITDGEKFKLVQSILAGEFAEHFVVKTNGVGEMPSATDSLYVGYGDCPVGTQWLGRLGNVNGKVVFVTAEDMKDGDLVYTCYVVGEEYQTLLNDHVTWNFETVNQ